MKKIIYIFICLFAFINVSASECTSEILATYAKYINSIDFSYEQLGESETFSIYVSGISGGISVDSGRTLSSDGFLDYISYGAVKYVSVFVSDGGVCAGEVVRVLELSVEDGAFVSESDESFYMDSGEVSTESENEVVYSADEINEGVVYKDEIYCAEEELTEDIYSPPVINQEVIKEDIVAEENKYIYIFWLLLILLIYVIILKIINKKRVLRKDMLNEAST